MHFTQNNLIEALKEMRKNVRKNKRRNKKWKTNKDIARMN